jgi:hypothetical protein
VRILDESVVFFGFGWRLGGSKGAKEIRLAGEFMK